MAIGIPPPTAAKAPAAFGAAVHDVGDRLQRQDEAVEVQPRLLGPPRLGPCGQTSAMEGEGLRL